jgi:hypothetical protein
MYTYRFVDRSPVLILKHPNSKAHYIFTIFPYFYTVSHTVQPYFSFTSVPHSFCLHFSTFLYFYSHLSLTYLGFPSIFLYLFAHRLPLFTSHVFTSYFSFIFIRICIFTFSLHLRTFGFHPNTLFQFFFTTAYLHDQFYNFFPPVSCHSSWPSSLHQTGSHIALRSVYHPPVLHPALHPALRPVLRLVLHRVLLSSC